MVFMNRAIQFGYWLVTHNRQGNQVLHTAVSIVFLNSDEVVRCLFVYFRGECLVGGLLYNISIAFDFSDVLLFCCRRVHNREADVIGRKHIDVKTEPLIGVEDLPTYSRFLDVSLPVFTCFAVFWKVYTEAEMDRLGTEIAV